MPKKSNTKRADGRYAVQVYLGRDQGKRKYKTVYGATKKEAEAKAEEIKLKIRKSYNVSHDSDPFSLWAERWYQQKIIDIGESQQNSYQNQIDKLNEYIGSIPIKSINPVEIQQVINEYYTKNPKTGEKSSKRLLEAIKSTASQVFRFAIENRVIDFNPAEYVKIPKTAPKSSRRALTDEEREWIMTTDHRMKTAAMIMLYAGLRRGEVIPLLWSDVDLENGTISVNKAVKMVDRKPIIKSTKTESGKRIVYIPVILSDYLKSIKKDNILVCPSLDGNMFTADSFRSAWSSYLSTIDAEHGKISQKKSKFDPRFGGITIEKITPHMLRHTFCTMMYESGVDVMTAKNQMGHSDIETTLNIYTHISEQHTAEEMKKLNGKTVYKSNASQ